MEPLDLLQALVAAESTSHLPTTAVEAVVLHTLDHPAIRIHRFDAGDGKANIVALTGPDPDPATRNGLTLSGHMDCVPALEPTWESDPFTLTIRDGRAYGRGACDMKGFDALAICAMREAAEQAVHLAQPLALILTCDEEVGVLGAPMLAKQLPPELILPRRTIVGEPTNFRVYRGHKGLITATLTIHGAEAHSSIPHTGWNAIEGAARFIAALEAEAQILAHAPCEDAALFPDSPCATLSVVMIQGGTAINIIPGSCVFTLSMRTLPSQGRDAFEEIVARAASAAGLTAGSSSGAYTLHIFPPTAGYSLPRDHTWVRDFCAATGAATATATGAPYATDAGALTALGFECIVWGPGDISRAHRANEWIGLDELERSRALLHYLATGS